MFFKYKKLVRKIDDLRQKNIALYKIIKQQDQEILDLKIKNSKHQNEERIIYKANERKKNKQIKDEKVKMRCFGLF